MKELIILISLVISVSVTSANDFSAVEKLLKKAMSSNIRTDKDKKRDANRLPIETLKFFGLKQDMKVIELLPGGGWYTKLLAPVLAEEGELSVALGTKRLSDNLLGEEGLEFINLIDTGTHIRRDETEKLNTLDIFDFGQKNVDMVFTFRNYHNFNFEGRTRINNAVFRALKPGGIYAVIDHTRRHMEGFNKESRRRIDPVLAIKEIQDAGFVLLDYSNLHYRPIDELKYEVGKKGVSGQTDRFTLKFIKPK